MSRFDIPLVAEGLTAYAIERQCGFERRQPPDKPSWAEQRRSWTDTILQGMARLEGHTPDPELMERFDARLERTRGCAAVETMPLAAQKELVRDLRCFVSALEDTGEDRKRQISVLRELFEDMAVQPSWDRSANGVDLAAGEARSALLRMTERKPIRFTRVLLGGETGPGGEAFVSGRVTDLESVRGTELFKQLTREYPGAAEWPAVCTVYHGGGQALSSAAIPADELELKLIREEGARFLDRPGIHWDGTVELSVPAHEPIRVLRFEPGKAPEETAMPNTLEALQAAVGGYIEVLGLDTDAVLICNEEGKLMGLPANRRVGGDTIAGTFLIAGSADGEFCSLSDEDAAYYAKEFEQPLPVYGDADGPTQWEFRVL